MKPRYLSGRTWGLGLYDQYGQRGIMTEGRFLGHRLSCCSTSWDEFWVLNDELWADASLRVQRSIASSGAREQARV
jgi:hypothetical protein